LTFYQPNAALNAPPSRVRPGSFAPIAREAPIANPPEPVQFHPYGDRSHMKGGGPGAYPLPPKPKGWVSYYNSKPRF